MCITPNRLDDGTEVACRKCKLCKRNRVNDLVGRCIAESRYSKKTYAVTLTYANDAGVNAVTLVYKDVQDFMKRLRKRYNVRYIVAGEYGTAKGRAHWHIILFFKDDYPEIKRLTNDFSKILDSKDITPFFVLQEQNSDFPMHIDMGFQCAINLIIDGGDTPIMFREDDGSVHKYNYDNALLNICNVFHGVPKQQDMKRMLLKFRVKDVSYDDACKRMMEYFSE